MSAGVYGVYTEHFAAPAGLVSAAEMLVRDTGANVVYCNEADYIAQGWRTPERAIPLPPCFGGFGESSCCPAAPERFYIRPAAKSQELRRGTVWVPARDIRRTTTRLPRGLRSP